MNEGGLLQNIDLRSLLCSVNTNYCTSRHCDFSPSDVFVFTLLGSEYGKHCIARNKMLDFIMKHLLAAKKVSCNKRGSLHACSWN